MSILVVDDENVVRRLIAEILRRAGYPVLEAFDGESALATLSHHLVSLVLTDVVMPGMSGIELLHEIRSDFPDLPVVIITGTIEQTIHGPAKAAGAAEVLCKPFSHADLLDSVRRTYRSTGNAESISETAPSSSPAETSVSDGNRG